MTNRTVERRSPAVAEDLLSSARGRDDNKSRDWSCVTFKRSNLKKKDETFESTVHFGGEKGRKLVTCKPVAALKTETLFPVQTRSFFASLEKEGGDVT